MSIAGEQVVRSGTIRPFQMEHGRKSAAERGMEPDDGELIEPPLVLIGLLGPLEPDVVGLRHVLAVAAERLAERTTVSSQVAPEPNQLPAGQP